jgi:hypothetical protein
MKKNISIVLGLALILFGTSLFAAGSSPMEIFTKVGINQAQENFIPSAIVWILLLTGAMSAMMQKIMPFIVGCVCCLIMALSPDIATAFGSFDFLSSAGVTAGTTTP